METIGKAIELPINGTGREIYVNWGDTADSYAWTKYDNISKIKHLFSHNGTFTVKIRGVFEKFDIGNSLNKTAPIEITSISKHGLTSYKDAFKDASKLTANTATISIGEIFCQDFESAFHNCSIFNAHRLTIMGKPKNLTRCFIGCKKFNTEIHIHDKSNIETFEYMLAHCEIFNQDVTDYVTQSTTNIKGMFLNCKKFNRTPYTWDTSKVISINSLFSGATIFNQDLTTFDFTSVQGDITSIVKHTGLNADLYGKLLIRFNPLCNSQYDYE